MKVFLLALLIVGICVFGMCFNIIFWKKEFPKFDVGSNEEMQKIGIRCFKDVDAELHEKSCKGGRGASCEGCKFYEK